MRTTAGRNEVVKLIGSGLGGTHFGAPNGHIAIGSGSTAPTAGDTALEAETERVAATTAILMTTHAGDTAQFKATLTLSAARDFREYGVLNASSAGTLLFRSVYAVTRKLFSGDKVNFDLRLKLTPQVTTHDTGNGTMTCATTKAGVAHVVKRLLGQEDANRFLLVALGRSRTTPTIDDTALGDPILADPHDCGLDRAARVSTTPSNPSAGVLRVSTTYTATRKENILSGLKWAYYMDAGDDEQPSAGLSQDAGPNALHLTKTNAPVLVDAVDGEGEAYDIDRETAPTAYLTHDDHTEFDLQYPFTLVAVFLTQISTGTRWVICGKKGAYFLERTTQKVRFKTYSGAVARDDDSIGGVSSTVWQKWVVTYDGANVVFYKDSNVADATRARTGQIDVNANKFAVAVDFNDGGSVQDWWHGTIGRVVGYGRVLSATEIQDVIDNPYVYVNELGIFTNDGVNDVMLARCVLATKQRVMKDVTMEHRFDVEVLA